MQHRVKQTEGKKKKAAAAEATTTNRMKESNEWRDDKELHENTSDFSITVLLQVSVANLRYSTDGNFMFQENTSHNEWKPNRELHGYRWDVK